MLKNSVLTILIARFLSEIRRTGPHFFHTFTICCFSPFLKFFSVVQHFGDTPQGAPAFRAFFERVVDQYCSELAEGVSSGIDVHCDHVQLAQRMASAWGNFSVFTFCLQRAFNYLDKSNSGLDLTTTALVAFAEVVFWPRRNCLISSMEYLIHEAREGGTVDSSLFRSCVAGVLGNIPLIRPFDQEGPGDLAELRAGPWLDRFRELKEPNQIVKVSGTGPSGDSLTWRTSWPTLPTVLASQFVSSVERSTVDYFEGLVQGWLSEGSCLAYLNKAVEKVKVEDLMFSRCFASLSDDYFQKKVETSMYSVIVDRHGKHVAALPDG